MAEALDTLEYVVNLARERLNDMIASAGGDVLTDTQAFTIWVINGAWRRLQEKLAKLGFLRLTNSIILTVPAGSSGASNPTVLTWASSPPLPSDFISPLDLQERVTGSGSNFYRMDGPIHPLPLVFQQVWNKLWDWIDDTLVIPGTLQQQDVWVRYAALQPDFVPAATTAFASQTVPINRCADAFSLYMVAEVSGSRGDLDKDSILKMADEAVLILVSRENPGVLATEAAA